MEELVSAFILHKKYFFYLTLKFVKLMLLQANIKLFFPFFFSKTLLMFNIQYICGFFLGSNEDKPYIVENADPRTTLVIPVKRRSPFIIFLAYT